VRVNDDLRKTVVFFGFEDPTPGKGGINCIGTGFLMVYDGCGYIVTAKHLAHGLSNDPFVVRLNKKDGTSENLQADNIRWYEHPQHEVDIAVTPFSLPTNAPYDAVHIPESMMALDALKHGEAINVLGIGDLTYVVGLFRLMSGERRNLPIVHSGAIAMMPGDEKIPVKDWRDKTKRLFVEGYLVETQALEGLSGSPVFVRPTVGVDVSPKHVLMNPATAHEWRAVAPRSPVFLLGLWSGSWDAPPDEVISVQTGKTARVSVGIGVVVPAVKIQETLMTPELIEARAEVKKRREAQQPAAEMDSAIPLARPNVESRPVVPPELDDDANPRHLEDFRRLVDVAARKRPQGDQT
jgi:hypothetical protein